MLLNVFILIVNEIVPVPVSTVSSFNAVSYWVCYTVFVYGSVSQSVSVCLSLSVSHWVWVWVNSDYDSDLDLEDIGRLNCSLKFEEVRLNWLHNCRLKSVIESSNHRNIHRQYSHTVTQSQSQWHSQPSPAQPKHISGKLSTLIVCWHPSKERIWNCPACQEVVHGEAHCNHVLLSSKLQK